MTQHFATLLSREPNKNCVLLCDTPPENCFTKHFLNFLHLKLYSPPAVDVTIPVTECHVTVMNPKSSVHQHTPLLC